MFHIALSTRFLIFFSIFNDDLMIWSSAHSLEMHEVQGHVNPLAPKRFTACPTKNLIRIIFYRENIFWFSLGCFPAALPRLFVIYRVS